MQSARGIAPKKGGLKMHMAKTFLTHPSVFGYYDSELPAIYRLCKSLEIGHPDCVLFAILITLTVTYTRYLYTPVIETVIEDSVLSRNRI